MVYMACLESRERQPINIVSTLYQTPLLYTEKNLPFPTKGNNSPIVPIPIRLFLHLCRERNSTHNPISKLLIQHRLIRIPIILNNLIESVNKRLPWGHFHRTAPVRESAELLLEKRLRNVEDGCEILDVLGRCLGLAVEDGCCCYFIAANMLGNLFETEFFGCFGFEEGLGGGREVGVLGGLYHGRD